MDLDQRVHADVSTEVAVKLAGTLLVDRRGWVLLQERDEITANPRTGQAKRWSIWTAPVDLADDDIVLGEGRRGAAWPSGGERSAPQKYQGKRGTLSGRRWWLSAL